MTDYDDAPTNVQGPPPPPGKPLSKDQKSAIAAALVGTASLGGAAYGMAQYLDDSGEPVGHTDSVADLKHSSDGGSHLPDPVPTPEPTPGPEPAPTPEPHISTHDRNDMTFAEAFHDARQEMGGGHYFEWHGQLYNTFYQDEWEKMSPNQHQDFLATVYGDDMPGSGGGAGHDVPGAHQGEVLASGEIPSPPDVPPAIDNDPNVTVDASRADHVAVADHDPQADVTVDDATGTGFDEQMLTHHADIATAELDGHQVEVYDLDNDDHPDAILIDDSHVAMIDTNHDHILDTQAVYDPDTHQLSDFHAMDQHLTIDGSMDILHHSDVSFASGTDLGPDFNNADDITDFV